STFRSSGFRAMTLVCCRTRMRTSVIRVVSWRRRAPAERRRSRDGALRRSPSRRTLSVSRDNRGRAMDDTPEFTSRGDFLKQLAALVATVPFAGIGLPTSTAPQPAGHATPVPSAPPGNLVGIQMGPHTMLDEGIEHSLDVCQETASIDTVFTYCYSYGG